MCENGAFNKNEDANVLPGLPTFIQYSCTLLERVLAVVIFSSIIMQILLLNIR